MGKREKRLEQQIKNVDYEIDEEIYKLYGITEGEKKVIEDSLKWFVLFFYTKIYKFLFLV